MLSADFFKIKNFQNYFQEYDQSVNQIMPNILSGTICVQIVCKYYQQTTIAGKELKHAASHKDSDMNWNPYLDKEMNQT